MSPEEFRAAAHQTVDWMADYLRDIRDYPVLATVEPGALAASLPKSGPERGERIDAILEDFSKAFIVPGITHWNHPRFFGYFSISGSGPGILGEMLAAALNVNHMVWKTGPSATELEQVSLGWLREWLGLPEEFFGIIHDTASTSTLQRRRRRQRSCARGRRRRSPGTVPLHFRARQSLRRSCRARRGSGPQQHPPHRNRRRVPHAPGCP